MQAHIQHLGKKIKNIKKANLLQSMLLNLTRQRTRLQQWSKPMALVRIQFVFGSDFDISDKSCLPKNRKNVHASYKCIPQLLFGYSHPSLPFSLISCVTLLLFLVFLSVTNLKTWINFGWNFIKKRNLTGLGPKLGGFMYWTMTVCWPACCGSIWGGGGAAWKLPFGAAPPGPGWTNPPAMKNSLSSDALNFVSSNLYQLQRIRHKMVVVQDNPLEEAQMGVLWA